MTKFVTVAIYSGTKKIVAIPGNHPIDCVWKAKKNQETKRASAFMIYERSSGHVVLTATN